MAATVERLDRAFTSAATCTNASTSKVEAYIAAGIAPATHRAYQSDLEHFRDWGGSILAADDHVATYLATMPALTRLLAVNSVAHGRAESGNSRGCVG